MDRTGSNKYKLDAQASASDADLHSLAASSLYDPPLTIKHCHAMTTQPDNPFDINTVIARRFEHLILEPAPATDAPTDGGQSPALPQLWQISGTHDAKQITALDRSLEEVTPVNALFQHLSDLNITGRHEVLTRLGPIQFDGSALLCRCPDCDAPMSIRLWLGLADCWRCPASIVLDEEVVESIAAEVEARDAQPMSEVKLPAPPPTPIELFGSAPLDTVAPRFNTGAAAKVDKFESEISDELDQLTRRSPLAKWIRRLFRITPAWMVSFLLHMIALLILAVIVFGDPRATVDDAITLSTFLDPSDQAGGNIRNEDPIDTLEDDVAIATKMKLSNKDTRVAILEAARDALELRTPQQSAMRLPKLSDVKKNITTKAGHAMSFATRDPRVRAEIVQKEGGTNLTEASVARGLRWLASVQNKDGSWSLKNYHQADRGKNKGDVMGTALALLPFLGAGQTHEYGSYQTNVSGGLRWLIERQKDDGDLRAGTLSQSGMYAHGQATIVLSEALALTGDRQFLDPVQRAVEFIEASQHRRGGWRYRPNQPGDTSVFGWQMMALQSARAARMDVQVQSKTLALADQFLDSVTANPKRTQIATGATYAYQPGREATEIMTAEAILCRMYLGWRRDDPRIKDAIAWLADKHMPSRKDRNLYYWYYGTQVMHHFGGEPWERWNESIRTMLIESQDSRGRYPGSWSPNDYEWGKKGGRIYTTSMAVCTLEVYYRHLPLFKALELE